MAKPHYVSQGVSYCIFGVIVRVYQSQFIHNLLAHEWLTMIIQVDMFEDFNLNLQIDSTGCDKMS